MASEYFCFAFFVSAKTGVPGKKKNSTGSGLFNNMARANTESLCGSV